MTTASLVTLTVDNSSNGKIAVLTVNHPPVNTITAAVRADLNHALNDLATMPDIQAVILLCAGSTFFSGADIGEFAGPPQEEAYRHLYARFEMQNVPVLAAMHGTVLGGGLEIALACHYRIALPGTRFGLPEVTLGIIPGAGGTQRMPRLIGIENTLQMVVSTKPVDTAQAQQWGLIDAVVEGDLREQALAYAHKLLQQKNSVRRTRDLAVSDAAAVATLREAAIAQAKKLYPNRTAALTAIEAICAVANLSFDQGLDYETKLINQAKVSDESKGLVHAFFAERETRRIPDLPADVKARAIKRAGIVGAGTMGGGIAMCFANAGMPVTLLDSTQEALDRGRANIERTYQSMVKRGRMTEADQAARLQCIDTSLDYAALGDADVIIEAVYENMDLKKQIFSKLDHVAKPGAILASNTSSLDVTEIARTTTRPGDVIGMHFFSPANVMPLLEVVRTELTSAETIRTVMDLAKPLRKTPVLSKVCYGFIGNRMMEGYAREAERMVLEGATPRQVDSVLERFGMAMGILAVFDLAGIDVCVNMHNANAHLFAADPTYYQADYALHDAGRLGQKTRKGYYLYQPGDNTRHDDPEAVQVLHQRGRDLGVAPRTHSDTEILERCLYPLLNEGFRILEEGIALRAGDIDVVWTAGYGYPRYRGGPMFYADTLGLNTLLAGMRKYQQEFGPMHWQPAALLVELVDKGLTLAEWERGR